MGRAMGFAALAMLTVFPLLVVVAAASAATHHGLSVWVVYGMGLTGSSARAVIQIFSAPARVLSTTSAFSLLLLAVFGMTFAGSVQAGFERVWGLPAGPWHKYWRQAVWLTVFIAYIYAAATVGSVTGRGPGETAGRVSVAVVLGIAFFWWGLRFLVGGRVSYLAALPSAVATVAFLAGLRVFSALVFEPLIVTNAVTYGTLGTVLIVQSWLIGVGWAVYGGQLFGRWFHDAWLQAWAENHWGRRQPGGLRLAVPVLGGVVGHGEETQCDRPGALRCVAGGVPVLPLQGEVLLKEREQLLFGHGEAAAAQLGPALRALVLGEDLEVQVDVVLCLDPGVFNGRRPLGRCHLLRVGRLDVERQGPPPPLPPGRLLGNLLHEPLLGQLAQVVARRSGAFAQCAGQAGGVRLPVLLEVAEDAPAQRIGQCPVDRGTVTVGAAVGFRRGN